MPNCPGSNCVVQASKDEFTARRARCPLCHREVSSPAAYDAEVEKPDHLPVRLVRHAAPKRGARA